MSISSIVSFATVWLSTLAIPGPTAQATRDYHIEFEKIDNRVEVYMGDSLIYDSGIIRKNPKLAIWVDIDDSLLDYSKELTIKLINGMEGVRDGDDIHWEVEYYVFQGEEVLYWEWLDSDDGKAGVVLVNKYTLD